MSFDEVIIVLQQILLTLIDFDNNEIDLLNKKAIGQEKKKVNKFKLDQTFLFKKMIVS